MFPQKFTSLLKTTSYDDAKAKLEETFNKTPNAIFARYQLTTRKQEVGESLEDFLLSLHRLSKNCQLQDVTKEQYRQELVRDAFVNNLRSPSIHMRLLKKDELSLETRLHWLQLWKRRKRTPTSTTLLARSPPEM